GGDRRRHRLHGGPRRRALALRGGRALTEHLAATRDPREELAELAAAVRAYVEWQGGAGAGGVPLTEGAPPPHARGAAGATEPPAPVPTFAAPQWSATPASAPAPRPAPPVVAPPPAPPKAPPPPAAITVGGAPPHPAPQAIGEDERRTHLALLAEEVRSCTR